jgi:hypothetical protein
LFGKGLDSEEDVRALEAVGRLLNGGLGLELEEEEGGKGSPEQEPEV